jgi:hypothetical protein
MATEWTIISNKKKHKYTEVQAQRFETAAKCRNLAPALRSDPLEKLYEDGWEYGGVLKANDDAAFDSAYAHKFVPVKNNQWGDSIILRKPYPKSDSEGK